MNIPVIENACWGIGDAVSYCWVIHSAKAAGVGLKFNIRRWDDIFRIFGVEDSMLTLARGKENWHPPKGEFGEPNVGWVKSWLAGYGIGDVPLVRPPYVEDPADGEWADKAWEGRDAETGSRFRVLLFPDVAWVIRRWPKPYWVELGAKLAASGFNVAAMSSAKDGCEGMPFGYWGQSMGKLAALVKRTDLVVGNDSGPAHVAGTLDVPTVAITGGSRKELFFDHLPSVATFSQDPSVVGCVGCNFESKRGCRAACSFGCQALYRTLPNHVYDRIMEVVGSPC